MDRIINFIFNGTVVYFIYTIFCSFVQADLSYMNIFNYSVEGRLFFAGMIFLILMISFTQYVDNNSIGYKIKKYITQRTKNQKVKTLDELLEESERLTKKIDSIISRNNQNHNVEDIINPLPKKTKRQVMVEIGSKFRD